MSETSTHIGRKISRIREIRGMKQEALAFELGVSQQAVSKMEQSERIEDDVLAKVANALGVSPETIRNYSDEAAIYNIQNNNEGIISGPGPFGSFNNCSFNPLDKLMEVIEKNELLHEENKKLYERLLASEREKVELLKGKKD
ncbi:MAG TPA: helix-turn-helix transcriptional regulator [Sphingobacteriaceae bacterium]